METSLDAVPVAPAAGQHVAPWWLGFLFLVPVRRLWEHPTRLLGPWVRPGDLVVDLGCGMGFFTLDLARLAGPRGRVIGIDVAPRVLSVLRWRLRRSGLAPRVELRRGGASDPGLDDCTGSVDVVVAPHIIHESPDAAGLLARLARALRPGGRLFLSEPRGHVTAARFASEVELARQAGLVPVATPHIRRTLAVVLTKPAVPTA